MGPTLDGSLKTAIDEQAGGRRSCQMMWQIRLAISASLQESGLFREAG